MSSTSASGLASEIDSIYQTLFNRDPLPAGLSFWENAVTSGSITEAQLPAQIALAAAPADQSTFQAKYPSTAASLYANATAPASASATSTPASTSVASTPATTILGMSPLVLLALAVAAYFLMEDHHAS